MELRIGKRQLKADYKSLLLVFLGFAIFSLGLYTDNTLYPSYQFGETFIPGNSFLNILPILFLYLYFLISYLKKRFELFLSEFIIPIVTLSLFYALLLKFSILFYYKFTVM